MEPTLNIRFGTTKEGKVSLSAKSLQASASNFGVNPYVEGSKKKNYKKKDEWKLKGKKDE